MANSTARKFITGSSLMKKLQAALGLEGKFLRRIVLDVHCERVATVYIEEIATGEPDDIVASLNGEQIEVTDVEPSIVVKVK